MSDKNEWDLIVTWRIDDFCASQMGIGEKLISPEFKIKSIDNSKWCFFIYPGGWQEENKEKLYCFLFSTNYAYSNVAFKFQISTTEKIILVTDQNFVVVVDEGCCGIIPDFIKLKDVFSELEKCPADTLFIRCSIKRNYESEKLSLKKEIRTRIVSHKCSFEWKVNVHEDLQCVRGESYFSLGDEFYHLSVAIPREDVDVTVRKLKVNNILNRKIAGKIVLLDITKSEVFWKRDTYSFDAELGNNAWEFPSLITKKQLTDNVTEYVKDGKILFLCEFFLLSEDEKPETVSVSNFCHINSLITLSDNFRGLLANDANFDVKLVAKNNVELQAHRSVLAVRSPVFCAMFNQEMTENRTGFIKIEDVNSNTLKRFLEFLYTGVVEDLDCEKAIKLLMAADKYEVPTLKEVCAHFLMSGLSEDNVCEILTLADRIRHESLKNTCLDYAAHHVTRLFSNPDINKWIKENTELSVEITLRVSKAVRNSWATY